LLARQGLRAILAGPITFAADRDGFKLRGSTKIGALWMPDLTSMKMASPRESILNPYAKLTTYTRYKRVA
jgi:hypothetical protein